MQAANADAPVRASREASALTSAQISYLDLLRGFAAFAVLLGHAGDAFMRGTWLASGILQIFGVVTFFLISGFLITRSVLSRSARPGYGLAPYLIDRFFRIFTPYVPALIAVAVVDAYTATLPDYPYGRDYTLATWIANLLMLQDYPLFQVLRRVGVPDQWWFFASFGSARPFWTVMIEWWIYLLFGWMVFVVLAKRRVSPATLAVVAVLAVVPGYHFIGGYAQCLTMLWMLGMAAAYFWHTQPERLRRRPVLARHAMRIGAALAGFGLLCLMARLVMRGIHYELQHEIYFAVALFGMFLMLGELRRPMPRLIAAPIAFIAEFSYSLYLTHFTVIVLVAALLPGRVHDPVLFWAVVAASIVVAIVFWALFERHHRFLAGLAHKRLRSSMRAVPAPAGSAAS